MFPLNLVIFPSQQQALHIFEPRYRQLVQETLDDNAPFGIALIREGGEAGGGATTFDVGCAVRLRHVQNLADGRYNIICEGTRRFRIVAPLGEDPYLRAEVEFLADPDDANDEAAAGIAPVISAKFKEHIRLTLALQDGWQRTAHLPARPVALADHVAARLDVPTGAKQEILQAPLVFTRLEFLLKALQRENTALAERLILHRRQKLQGLGVLN